MENFRKWSRSVEDHPADGLEPINPEAYETHEGGAFYVGHPQMPLLSEPDEVPDGAPIKDRKAIHRIALTDEIVDSASGEIDFEKLSNLINLAKSSWKADPERDRRLQARREEVEMAIQQFQSKGREQAKEIEDNIWNKIKKGAEEIQAILRARFGTEDTVDISDAKEVDTIETYPPGV